MVTLSQDLSDGLEDFFFLFCNLCGIYSTYHVYYTVLYYTFQL